MKISHMDIIYLDHIYLHSPPTTLPKPLQLTLFDFVLTFHIFTLSLWIQLVLPLCIWATRDQTPMKTKLSLYLKQLAIWLLHLYVCSSIFINLYMLHTFLYSWNVRFPLIAGNNISTVILDLVSSIALKIWASAFN